MSQVIAFIPARCGSKSIPMKNIERLCGKPLIYWTIEALERCSAVSQIIIATDCAEIEAVVNSFHFNKATIYRRSDANAQDTSSTESVMLEFLEQHPLQPEDIFLLVQATSPLTSAIDFEKGLEKFFSTAADSLLTCVRVKRFIWNEKGESLNYDYQNRPRRQDFDGMLLENGAFYISKIKNIISSKNRLSGKIAVYEMPEYTATELDEPHDWIVLEQLMNRYRLPESVAALPKIKLVVSDVDGVLTDAGMYYSEAGDELKKFNTHDGMAFNLMQKLGIKTGIVTSENTKMVERRAQKLKLDYIFQGMRGMSKLEAIQKMCEKEGISLEEVAYIGDDVNCQEALKAVGLAACPANALADIKAISGIFQLERKGGEGVVREFYERFIRPMYELSK